jgi:spoIIIJ-associated protein
MSETCVKAQEFFQQVFDSSNIKVRIKSSQGADHCVLNFEGEDSPMLLIEGGELLDAVQHLANQIFGREAEGGERFICDVDNFRATREAELRAMARHAAMQVRKSGVPFTFGPMNSNERRIIHTALASEEDLHTESVGEGSARRLKVNLK